jgi:uncharacterized protein
MESQNTTIPTPATTTPATTAPAVSAPAPILLMWDSPNMDMSLSNILGGQKPSKVDRPDMQSLATWVHHRSVQAGVPAEAVVALNVGRDTSPDAPIAKFIQVLRQLGFRVFVKPKDTPDSDVDDAIVALAGSKEFSEVIVATHDSPLLGRIRKETSAPLTVLCFSEVMPCHRRNAVDAMFLDVADVPGLFRSDLPRLTTPSFKLIPSEGLLLPPLAPLFRDVPAEACALEALTV